MILFGKFDERISAGIVGNLLPVVLRKFGSLTVTDIKKESVLCEFFSVDVKSVNKFPDDAS